MPFTLHVRPIDVYDCMSLSPT